MRTEGLTRRLSRLRALPPLVVDSAAATIFVVAVALERVARPLDNGSGTITFAAVLTLTMAGALVARRSYPLAAFLVSSVALCAESLAGLASNASPYANQVAVFSLGLYATRRHARWGLPIVLVCLVVYFAGDPVTPPSDAVGVLFVWLATWAVGYTMARRREEQDRTRHAVQRQAVAEEQTRVARELHDVVGHTVNLLVVQAGAARLLLDSDPRKARDLLATMEQTGRDSLAELDHVLAHLRSGARTTDEHPTPGVAQIPDLVDHLTDSRIRVTLTMDPGLRLPRNLDLSAYRIVQEALTNVLKHAAPCTATVDVRRDGSTVVVEVADDGPGLSDRHHSGRGLTGIAERVSICGGRLEQDHGPERGFMVRAVLPLP